MYYCHSTGNLKCSWGRVAFKLLIGSSCSSPELSDSKGRDEINWGWPYKLLMSSLCASLGNSEQLSSWSGGWGEVSRALWKVDFFSRATSPTQHVSVLFVVPKIMAREEKSGQVLGKLQETLMSWSFSLNFVPSHCRQTELGRAPYSSCCSLLSTFLTFIATCR